MPDEYKDPQKQEAGRKSREKQRLEEPIPAGMNPAESSSNQSTEQESQTFDRPNPETTVSQLQSQLSNTKQELEEAKKRATLLEQQNVEDVSSTNNEGVGLVRADKVTKISENDKKGGSTCRKIWRTDKKKACKRG
jgi:hypothetical protein